MDPPWNLLWHVLSLFCAVALCNNSKTFHSGLPDSKLSKTLVTNFTRLKSSNNTGLFRKQLVLENQPSHSRSKRSHPRNKACEMLIAIDEPLYRTYNSNMEEISKLAKDYVKELNIIYHRTVFRNQYSDIYFRIKEIRILFDFCLDCNQTQTVYLTKFTHMNTSRFCLAHVFTYRDFPAGVQGLAWKSTICKPSYNTGFTTLLNHQVRATREDSIMTFAHEVGHNVGAKHDEDVGCSEGFIMSVSGSKRKFHEHEFSSCSMQEMSKELDGIIQNNSNCFKNVDENEEDQISFCGDYKVEGEEECDCGLDYVHCSDPCCYAARINPDDIAANKSATPCRRNKNFICLHPFDSVWTYGFLAPWVTILVVATVSGGALLYDWKHARKCYGHVTQPKELIRSETTEQMVKRLERQQTSENNRLMGKNYVLDVTQIHRGGRQGPPAHPAMPPPPPPPMSSIPPPPSAPPPPPPKDYPSAPFLGEPPTSHGVSRLKDKYERKY